MTLSESTVSQFAFGLMLVVCIGAAFGSPWWTAAIGSVILAALSVALHQLVYARQQAIMASIPLGASIFSSVLNAAAANAASFAAGRAIGWLWGV